MYRYVKKMQCLCASRHTYGFGVHSPYLYHFTRYVVYERHPFYIYPAIEKERKNLLQSNEPCVSGEGLSRVCRLSTVGQLARILPLPPRHARLLHRSARFAQADTLLQLGCGLGVDSAYMASARPGARCVVIEPQAEVAEVAGGVMRRLGITNVDLRHGTSEELLPSLLDEWKQLDFAYIGLDSDPQAAWVDFSRCVEKTHTGTLIMVGCPYLRPETERVWQQMKRHRRVTSSIDLGRSGILFFNTDLHKQHYRMRL